MHWSAAAKAAAWRCRAAQRWCGRRRTRSCNWCVAAVAVGGAAVAGLVVAVAVEKLALPVTGDCIGGQMRFDGDDLAFDGEHLGDRAAVQRVELRPGRWQ